MIQRRGVVNREVLSLCLSKDGTLKKQAPSVKEQHIPSALDVEVPNAETIAAMEEIEEMIKSGKSHGYESVDDMFKELGI